MHIILETYFLCVRQNGLRLYRHKKMENLSGQRRGLERAKGQGEQNLEINVSSIPALRRLGLPQATALMPRPREGERALPQTLRGPAVPAVPAVPRACTCALCLGVSSGRLATPLVLELCLSLVYSVFTTTSIASFSESIRKSPERCEL